MSIAAKVQGMKHNQNTSTGESKGLRPETISYLEQLYGVEACATALDALAAAYADYDHSITATMLDTLCQVVKYEGPDREAKIRARMSVQTHHPSMRPFAHAVRLATGVDITTR